jgi:hypothetical protein
VNTETGPMEGAVEAGGAADRAPAIPVSRWVLWILLVGTIVDYGSGLLIKPAVFALTMLYLLVAPGTWAVWGRCLPDLAVVLGIPAVLVLVHGATTSTVTLGDIAQNLWRLLGSPAYYLLIPLFLREGAERTSRAIVAVLTVLAGLTVLLVAAHASGTINLFAYAEFMTNYRLALFGTDARAAGLEAEGVGIPAFGASQAFPVAFALALGQNPVGAFLLAAATILGTQRGQVLGLALGALILFLTRRKGAGPGEGGFRWSALSPLARAGVVLLGIVAVGGIAVYLGNVISLLVAKAGQLGAEDDSLLVRIGHVGAYLELASSDPLGLLWGYGPFRAVYNAFNGELMLMTEMVVLVYLLWYGVPYTVLFYGWIGASALHVLRAAEGIADRGLVAATVVLVTVGNINPVMLTPLAFLLLATLRARLLEREVEE